MRISDWSSDVCSSDLRALRRFLRLKVPQRLVEQRRQRNRAIAPWCAARGHGYTSPWSIQFRIADQITDMGRVMASARRSEEHTSETPVTNAHLVCRLLLEKKKKNKT